MRRTPIYDRFDDQEEPPRAVPSRVRRITSAPTDQAGRRHEVRYVRGSQRAAPRRGPDARVWFVRGAVGFAALAALWLGLQALFPMSESRVSEAPTPTLAVDASTVGAPEPPAAVLPPPVSAQPPPSAVGQPAPAAEGDRLPGLPTPAAATTADQTARAGSDASSVQSAPPAAPAAEAPAAAAQAPSEPATDQPPAAQPEPVAQAESPGPAQAEGQPPADRQEPEQQPAPESAQQEPPAGPAAKPTAAPIPPPENPAPRAVAVAPPAPVRQQPAAPPPPPAASSGGPFELAASASPANPLSEQAQVTISVRATQNGAPVAGVSCMATVHYRTATARQPAGGFTTNASGVGSFVLDARDTTYGFFIPVDVTCTGRSGTATARTGFTPVKGR